MITKYILNEADISDKIAKDPGKAKQLAIAWRHDHTLPPSTVAKAGPKVDDKALAKIWSDMLEYTLQLTNYGDLSRDMKFAEWLTKLYITGAADWEEISGEGGDALGAWNALSIRGLLKPADQDLNRFNTMKALQRRMGENVYSEHLSRIRDQAKIDKMRKTKLEVVIVDDDRYWAAVPFNYGSCYIFNYTGHNSNFCTGGSSGEYWFRNYAPRGPVVMIVDKKNIDEKDGKWQMHAETNQLVNSSQDDRNNVKGNDKRFAELFPGLMRRITEGMQSHAAELESQSKSAFGRTYNITESIADIKSTFPLAYASVAKGELPKGELPQAELPQAEQPPAEEPALIVAGRGPESIDEDVRRFMSPNGVNRLNPTSLSRRRIWVVQADNQRKSVMATNASDALRQVELEYPGWMSPGSIQMIAKVTYN